MSRRLIIAIALPVALRGAAGGGVSPRYILAEGSTFRFLDDDGRENTDDWGLEREIDLDDLRTGTLAQDGTLSIRLAGDKHTLVFRRQAD